MSTMKIGYQEAEFLALLFDATLARMALVKTKINDFVAAESFLGYNANPGEESEEVLIDQMEMASHEMICLRSRINDHFGI